MINNSGNLDILHPYIGPDKVQIGDGSKISITRIGHNIILQTRTNFLLKNLPVVPSLTKNLVSVHHFAKDNSCSTKFNPFGFSMKDYPTRKTLLHCSSSGSLYLILFPSIVDSSTPLAFVSIKESSSTWYRPLAHPGHLVFFFKFLQNYSSFMYLYENEGFLS